jgi:hypothetical protein
LHLFEAFVLSVEFRLNEGTLEALHTPVTVDFSTIPEMFDKITTKHALGERSVLTHEVGKQHRSTS